MGKAPEQTHFDIIHGQLSAALTQLAKSVDHTLKAISLRTELAATIMHANKAEDAAAALRRAAIEMHDAADDAPPEDEDVVDGAGTSTAIHKVESACVEFAEFCRQGGTSQSERRESTIAISILGLHDRCGGLLK
jgi:hypothetical protein